MTYINSNEKSNFFQIGEKIEKLLSEASYEVAIEIYKKYLKIFRVLKSALEYADTSDIPNALLLRLQSEISRFNKEADKLLITFDIITNDGRKLKEARDVIEIYYDNFFSSNVTDPFILAYSAIVILGNTENLTKDSNDQIQKEIDFIIDDLKHQYSDTSKEISKILEGALEFKEKVKNEVVSEYAKIFQEQADKHSSFNLKPLQIGKAQIWLISSIIFIIIFFVGLGIFSNYLEIESYHYERIVEGKKVINKPVKFISLENLALRVIYVSMMIYLIVVCIRQFLINQHLHILNKHRQNSLNSYKLFANDMVTGDSSMKQSLMLEVAKSIFEAGSTGYLHSKDNIPNPSIIEMTRFMNSKVE